MIVITTCSAWKFISPLFILTTPLSTISVSLSSNEGGTIPGQSIKYIHCRTWKELDLYGAAKYVITAQQIK